MTTAKRPYLRSADRRRHLLDAAGRVFERHGLLGITMVAVAEEAGVSRRLVYDHFPDLPALYDAFFDDRASHYIAFTDEVGVALGGDPRDAVALVFRHLLTMSPDDQRALRLVVADTGTAVLDPIRDRLRAHLLQRWLPVVDPLIVDPTIASALVWTMLGALLTLADLTHRGEIDADRAALLATGITTGFGAVSRRSDHPI